MTGDRENRFSVLSCPWCGVDMGLRTIHGGKRLVFGYRVADKASSHTSVPVRGPGLRFLHRGRAADRGRRRADLQQPPTLLIGTVDKFAMMPWHPASRILFGIDNPNASPRPS